MDAPPHSPCKHAGLQPPTEQVALKRNQVWFALKQRECSRIHRVLVGLQLLRRVVAPVEDPWRLFIERRLRVDQRAHLQCIRDADDAGVGMQKQA